MLFFLLALGGGAVLASALSDGVDDLAEEREDAVDQEFEMEVENPAILLDLSDVTNEFEEVPFSDRSATISLPRSHIGNLDPEVVEPYEGLPDEVLELIINDNSGSIPDFPVCTVLKVGEAFTENMGPALSDWAQNENVSNIDLADCDIIYADVVPEGGSLHILRADYYERTGSETGVDLDVIHTGANVYFMPSGEEFPEDYAWSESSASLFNVEEQESDHQDFGAIRLVSRISTGLLYGDVEDTASIEFSHRAFVELQERFLSNTDFKFSS